MPAFGGRGAIFAKTPRDRQADRTGPCRGMAGIRMSEHRDQAMRERGGDALRRADPRRAAPSAAGAAGMFRRGWLGYVRASAALGLLK
ncbi:hypothetical protein KL86PLE_40193 [uncultured Pleomorphomonas sp.]|uniref:Uncharacterized protein n=1 Tax=uncultured Pleomorphomonas sp. TaxID=442121 RepID=A0A212LFX0_9HYPH|nr:hypothetical protein KL86PLE_40193 [uncultured Pleomorphomonas sp.]